MKHHTVTATMGFVIFFMFLLGALLVLAPGLASWYVTMRAMPRELGTVILVAFYICCPPAAAALFFVYRLLQNIRREQTFCSANTRLMTLIAWCCLAVAVVTFAAAFWYTPFFFITGAMLFIFLIVRVVRSCFAAAIELKEENSLTI